MSRLEFTLPDVGEGLAQGEIVKWHVAPGQPVHSDATLVEVETDKAIVEIPSPATGLLTSQGAKEGEILAVGAVLATFEIDDDEVTPAQSVVTPEPKPSPSPGPNRSQTGRVLASPAVRKAARELGLELSEVRGSGARGQITRADLDVAKTGSQTVASAASQQSPIRRTPSPQGADQVEPLQGLRRRIAQTMERAWREIPHVFHMEEIDVTQLVAARRSLNEEWGDDGPKLSYLPFLLKACVRALQSHPSFNASIDTEQDRIIYRHRFNIGIATATDDGLIVPVLHDADRLSLPDIANEIATLAQLARTRKASVAQLSDATFTISNFGSYSAGVGMPIINPPQVAIAGFGRIRDGVTAHNGQAVVRPMLPVVVSADHRLNDGAHLGAFVSTLTTYLREPVRLLGYG